MYLLSVAAWADEAYIGVLGGFLYWSVSNLCFCVLTSLGFERSICLQMSLSLY